LFTRDIMFGKYTRESVCALKRPRTGQPLTQTVLTLCVLCALCSNSFTQEFKKVADGIEHAQIRREFKGKPVNFNLLRLDLKKIRLDVHHALDKAIGLETTSSIAKRKNAIAAINGGFFRLDKSAWAGEAAAGLLIDGELLSEGLRERGSLAIENSKDSGEVYVGKSATTAGFWVGTRNLMKREEAFDGSNRQRKPHELIIYTPLFGKTTLTEEAGTEIILDRCRKVYLKHLYEKSFYRTCKGVDIRYESKNSPIPRNGYVLSISPGKFAKGGNLINELTAHSSKKTNRLEVSIIYGLSSGGNLIASHEFLDVVAGLPQLIKNGKVDITWEQEKASKAFVETRHPRTAVEKLKDAKFLMLTADGRSEDSAGIDLYDLAAYMLELGAVDAMNLDGGGSTTMFLDGKVVNKPSDKEGERKIGDAILVTLRKKKR